MTLGFPSAAPGQKVGLFGGSFDPAHAGHVQLTAQAMRQFDLDRVWWLVSPGNPLKQRGPAPVESRIEGARAILSDPRVTVSGLEAKLGTRRTADTIAALQAIYPQVRFVWLMGSDNLVQFHLWDRWRAIAARVPIGVIARPGSKLAARESVAARTLARFRLPQRDARMLATRQPPAWVMVEVPFNDASSSAIRAMVHRPAGCEPATSK